MNPVRFILIVCVLQTVILLSGCATLFYPERQKVTIITGNDSAVVFVDGAQIGAGARVKKRIRKNAEAKRIDVVAPEYKSAQGFLSPEKRKVGFFVVAALNGFNYGFGLLLDLAMPKMISYPDKKLVRVKYRNPKRDSAQKLISLEYLSFDIANQNTGYLVVPVKYNYDGPNDEGYFEKTEAELLANLEAERLKKESLHPGKRKQGVKNTSSGMYSTDSVYSKKLGEWIVKYGLSENDSTLYGEPRSVVLIEGKIKKVTVFKPAFRGICYYFKAHVSTTWYIKTRYSEIKDSVDIVSWSDEFPEGEKHNDAIFDAIHVSFIELYGSEKLQKHLTVETQIEVEEELIKLKNPTRTVSAHIDAVMASVIVKGDNGHGSGFAITNDGYIITSYKVISSKYAGHGGAITVVTHDGTEHNANLMRVNFDKDLALLKIDYNFESCFKVNSEKNFAPPLNVFTIGAPYSTELAHTINAGIISGSRHTGKTELIQLSMFAGMEIGSGPLYDKNWLLQGVLVSKLTGVSAKETCFAIPVYKVGEYLRIAYE